MALLEVKHLSFGYAHKTPFEVWALTDVSFSLRAGECLCVIGRTGSGKSTLMQMLNALLTPEEGEVLLDGENIHKNKKSASAARFRVGLCFQYPESQLFGETAALDIAFGPRNMGLQEAEIADRVRKAAAIVGLTEAELRASPFDLSGGQKRRCAIAGVIAMQPEILILDEPTAGLDPAGRDAILSMIRRYRGETGSSVILVTHSMEIAALLADRILVLDRGRRYAFDRPAAVFADAEGLEKIGLDVPFSARLISRLQREGIALAPAYTVPSAADSIAAALQQKGGKRC